MKFTEDQLDHLKEIISIGIGRSANQLNKIVKNRVTLTVPKILIYQLGQIENSLTSENMVSVISMGFKGELIGRVELVLSTDNAIKIIDLITDRNETNLEMDQLRTAALSEVGNIVLNSLLGTIANMFKVRLKYSVPKYEEGMYSAITHDGILLSEYILILAETHFSVKNMDIMGSFNLFFKLDSEESILNLLSGSLKNLQ